jgi:hypothetical protein
MKIAVLGWGSLIWDPRGLAVGSPWQPDGPEVPLEFSRVSQDGRLTLVVDGTNGERLCCLYAISSSARLEDAVENLREREGTRKHFIGFVAAGGERDEAEYSGPVGAVWSWALGKGFDAAVWTALPPNFEDRTGREFSVGAAVSYLMGLREPTLSKAREYVSRAPAQIMTAVRRELIANGWLGTTFLNLPNVDKKPEA